MGGNRYLGEDILTFEEELVELLYKYEDEYKEGFLQKAWKSHKGFIGYGFFESYVAYCLMREYKPVITVDIGSACGFSSYPLNFASARNELGIVFSYELNEDRCKQYEKNMKKNDLYYIIYPGEVEKTIFENLLKRTHLEKINHAIDLLFIDASHEQPFAEWYLKVLVPKTRNLLHVHDVSYLPDCGEVKTVLAWLKEHPEYEVVRCWEIAYEDGNTGTKKPTELAKHFNFPPEIRGEANSSIWVKLS